MPTTLGATWATSHRYSLDGAAMGAWAAACQHAYEMLQGSLTPAQLEVAEITPCEPLGRRLIYGVEFMLWQACVTIPGTEFVLAYQVIDDLPNEEAGPSVRVGAKRPTPPPPR